MDFFKDNKDIQIPSKHNKIYYTLPLLDYMFRLLRVIIRPSSEMIQNYLIPSALWDFFKFLILLQKSPLQETSGFLAHLSHISQFQRLTKNICECTGIYL